MPGSRTLPSSPETLGMPDHAVQAALRNGLALWTRTTGNAFTLTAIEEIVAQQLVSLRRAAAERSPSTSPQHQHMAAPPRHWSDRD